MKQKLLQEKYPVYTLEVEKTETSFLNVDQIIAYLKECVDAHKIARYIAIFDHYSHTKALPDGSVADDILDAKNILFCFGTALPNAEVLSVRPRSIGVAEKPDRFVFSFLEAPMPLANQAMEAWVKGSVSTQPTGDEKLAVNQ